MSPSRIRVALAHAGLVVALSPAFAACTAKAATISYTSASGGQTTTITDSACTTGFVVSGSTLVCQSSSPPPPPPPSGNPSGAPTNCTPTNSPTTLTSAGGTVNLNVTGCTPAVGPLNYSWSRNLNTALSTASSTPSLADQLPANTNTSTAITYSYQVNVCDAGNNRCTGYIPSTPLTTTVPVAAAPNPTGGGGGGSGGGGAISCAGFSNTIVLDVAYAGQSVARTASFVNGEVVVARFTTPASLTGGGTGGLLNAIEYDGTPAIRTAALSTTPCDFAANAAGSNFDIGPSPNVYFGTFFGGFALQPSTTYYWNIMNVNQFNTPSCSGNCAIQVTLTAK